MLTPLPALEGYNTVQSGIGWLVRGSTAGASGVWTLAADFIIAGDAVTARRDARQDRDVIEALDAVLRTYRSREGRPTVFAPLAGRPTVDVVQAVAEGMELPITVNLPNSLRFVYESPMMPDADFRGWSPGDCGVDPNPEAASRGHACRRDRIRRGAQGGDRCTGRAAARDVFRTVRTKGTLPTGFEASFDILARITSGLALHRRTLAAAAKVRVG